MWEKSSRNREKEEDGVNADLSLRDAITMLGGDAPSRERLFANAARTAGISYSHAKKLFYGETTDPKASVRERIARAVQRLNKKAETDARRQVERTADLGELVARAVEADAGLGREVLALVLRRIAGDRPEDRSVD